MVRKLRTAVLVRQFNSDQGVPGSLFIKNEKTNAMDYFSRSLELPWIGNQSRLSCIPTGDYICDFTWSPKYKRDLYLVQDVPTRSGIRIHSASFAGRVDLGFKCHLLGCIALGKGFFGGPGTDSQLLLHTSRVTMARFQEEMRGEKFRLIVVGDFHERSL